MFSWKLSKTSQYSIEILWLSGIFQKQPSREFTGEHTCRSVISIKLLCSTNGGVYLVCNFASKGEFYHRYFSVNFLKYSEHPTSFRRIPVNSCFRICCKIFFGKEDSVLYKSILKIKLDERYSYK